LRIEPGASDTSLRKKWGRVAAVDVAGRDLGGHQLALDRGQRRAVVGQALHALQRPRAGPVEDDDLAGLAARSGGLTVHPEVAGRHLHEPVRLAGHHEGVLGQAHVQRLPRPPQGQQQAPGLVGGGGGDGHRSLEGGDRPAEGVGRGRAIRQVAGDERGDDLGVGGDLGRYPQIVGGPQLDVVVDVAVEGGQHVRPLAAVGLDRVERVGVGLGDDPDAGPPGVPEHGRQRARDGERPAEQLVLAQGRPQGGAVVAELADLGRRLVGEDEGPAPDPHRPGGEERVAGATDQLVRHRRLREVEAGTLDEHGDPGRVPAADLEPVEGRQRHLDGPPAVGGVDGGRPAEAAHPRGGAQSVGAHRPSDVAQPDQSGVQALDGGGVADVDAAGVELGLDAGRRRLEGGDAPCHLVGQPGAGQQRPHPGRSGQAAVGLGHGGGRPLEPLGLGTGPCEGAAGGIERIEDLSGGGYRPGTGAPEDGDDAAHRREGTRASPRPRGPPSAPAGATPPPRVRWPHAAPG
jgi:hypothetical protein